MSILRSVGGSRDGSLRGIVAIVGGIAAIVGGEAIHVVPRSVVRVVGMLGGGSGGNASRAFLRGDGGVIARLLVGGLCVIGGSITI